MGAAIYLSMTSVLIVIMNGKGALYALGSNVWLGGEARLHSGLLHCRGFRVDAAAS